MEERVISTNNETIVEKKLCKIRRIRINKFEKIKTGESTYKIIVRMYSYQENRSKIFVDDSELTRIIKHLNPTDNCLDGKYEYIKDLISVKVGKNKKYKLLIQDESNRNIDNIGEIEIHNYRYDREIEELKLESVEVFVHLISNASHIRGQKALFVKKELFEAVDEILRCGVDPKTTTKYINKWTSYYGLQASNSVPVTMPKCTVISDLYLGIEDIVDEVFQDYRKEDNTDSTKKKVDKFKYDVLENKNSKVKTCPFDGMGIVDVKMAEQWSKDLGLDYVPGSFQIRLCGVKGCLFVMPIKTFIEKVSKTSKLTDIDGNVQDYYNGDFNVILTKSMFKYEKFYNEEKKLEQWKREFHKTVHGYKRTFNICSFAVKYEDLKDELLTAYQPLQTLDKLFDLEEADRKKRLDALCGKTVNVIKSMYSDITSFLKYIGIDDEDDKKKINKESIKPYYRALEVNHALCNDKYIKMKMERTLQTAKERAYIGKLYVDGNYTVVGSDPYALLQHAFNMEVTGLLDRDEIYSNYWNKKNVTTVNVWRNPYIYREHWIAKCVSGAAVTDWFKYLDANIIVSIWDTNLLRCNSADTDGDILAQVKNDILESEVRKVIDEGKARTINPNLITDREDSNEDVSEVCISDVKAIIESEIRGFGNDIGKVINKISELWGEEQTTTTENYIRILSVVASLVIDFVKTGVKVPIPKDITDYIKINKIKKLRFMMYLPNNKKLRKAEEKALRQYENKKAKAKEKEPFNEEFVSKFSDKKCTLNYIMEYMKDNLENMESSYNEPEFDYLTLLNTKDTNICKKSHYVKVRDLFKQYVEDQKQISCERKKEMASNLTAKEEYNMLYKAFYDACRSELLCVCNDTGKVCTKSMILDCCIICCYTEFDEENYSHFDFLWNLFPDELVCRAGGKGIIQRKKNDEDLKRTLEERREKNTEKLMTLRNKKRCRIECLESKNITPDNFTIYKSEIADIKKEIPTSVKNYIAVRKIYFSYLVAYKRLQSMKKLGVIPCLDNSKNCMNNKCMEEITKLNNVQIKEAVRALEEMQIIQFHTGNHKGRRYKDCELLFLPAKENADEIYYNGMNYIQAFNIMHRHLSR